MTQVYERFTARQRVEHVTVMVLFTLLAVTGLPQKFYDSWWAAPILLALGGIDQARWIHRAAGLTFTLLTVTHLTTAIGLVIMGRSPLSLVPTRQDFNDAIQTLAVDHISAFVFGDSLRLYPIVQANPRFVQLTDASYGAKPISFAVPRNDADFRVLVDVTLQEMAKDGTYQRLWQATFPVGNPLAIIVWPGSPTLFGVKTTG